MADEVSIEELRAKLDAILRRVAGGEELTVTIDGKPVADLNPPPRPRGLKEDYLPMLENRPADPALFELLRDIEPEGVDDQGERLKRFYGDDL